MAESKIVLSAEDRTKVAFESAKAGLGSLHTKAVALTGVLAAVGVTAYAANLTSGIKDAINEWDELGKAAQRAGFESAQSMAEFTFAAKLASVDAAGLEAAVGKLAAKMADAVGGNKEAIATFKALGVQIRDTSGNLRPTEQVLADIAQKFASFRDGPEKTALALDLFGKSGKQLIPLLNGGAEGLQRLQEEFRKLHGTITDNNTKSAEQFNDNITRLQASAGGFQRELANNLLPTLIQISDKMVEAAKNGGYLRGVWEGIVETGKVLTGTDELGTARSRSARANDEMSRLGGMIDQQTTILERDPENTAAARRLAHLRKQLQDVQKEALAASDALKRVLDPGFGNDNSYTALEARRLGTDRRAAAPVVQKPTAATETTYEKVNKAVRERIELADQELTAGRQLTEAEKFEVKALEDLKNSKVKVTAAQMESTKAVIEEMKQKELLVQIQRSEYEHAMEIAKERQRIRNEEYKQGQELVAQERQASLDRTRIGRDMLEQIQFETSLLAMNTQEREVALAMRDLEKQGVKQGTEAWEKYAEAIKAAVLDRTKVREQADTFREIFESADRTAHDIFTNILEGGTNLWKKLKDTAKSLFFDFLYQMTVKKWIFNAAVQMTGTPMSVAQAAVPGMTGGGGGFIGNIGTAIGGLGNGIGTSIANMTGTGLDGFLATNGAFGTAGGIMGSISAAMPYIGMAVMAISLLKDAFKGEKRAGGQYNMGKLIANPSGGEIGQFGDASKAMADAISATLKALGSSSTLSHFNTGIETSERGKGFAYGGGVLTRGDGSSVGFGQGWDGKGYENRRGDMTAEQAGKAGAEELKQAFLQALQADNSIPEGVAAKLRGLNIDAMTEKELDGLIGEINSMTTAVSGLRQVAKLLPPEFDDLKTISFDAAAAIVEMSGGIDAFSSNLTNFYAKYFTEQERAAQTTANLQQVFTNLGLTMPATTAGFRELVLAQDKTTESGQKAFATLLSIADAFYGLKGATEETVTAIERATDAQQEAAITYISQGDLALSAAQAAWEQAEAWARDRTNALNDEANALETTARAQRAYADRLKAFRNELTIGSLAGNSPMDQYRLAKAEFDRLLAMDPNSDERKAGLEAAGREFLDASRLINASGEGYFRDKAIVLGAIEASQLRAESAAFIAEQQLDVVREQLLTLRTSEEYLRILASGNGGMGDGGGSGGDYPGDFDPALLGGRDSQGGSGGGSGGLDQRLGGGGSGSGAGEAALLAEFQALRALVQRQTEVIAEFARGNLAQGEAIVEATSESASALSTETIRNRLRGSMLEGR